MWNPWTKVQVSCGYVRGIMGVSTGYHASIMRVSREYRAGSRQFAVGGGQLAVGSLQFAGQCCRVVRCDVVGCWMRDVG